MNINKALAVLFVTSAMVGLAVLVMIFGWGLRPQSWWWIIGGGIFGQVILRSIGDKALKEDQ